MIEYPTEPEFVRDLSDEDLLEAYERTSGEEGDAEAMVLLAEIQRRGLDL